MGRSHLPPHSWLVGDIIHIIVPKVHTEIAHVRRLIDVTGCPDPTSRGSIIRPQLLHEVIMANGIHTPFRCKWFGLHRCHMLVFYAKCEVKCIC